MNKQTTRKCGWPMAAMVAAVVVVVVSAGMTGCSTTKQTRGAEPSGFLSDYSQLHKGKGKEAQLVYINPNVKWTSYTKIQLEPIVLWYEGDSKLDEVSRAELQTLVDHLHATVIKNLEGDYTFVDQPGPGVLRVRTAITEVKKSKVIMDVITTTIPQLRLLSGVKRLATGTHAFVGRASIEVEILDAVTGERLAAAVDERAGGRAFRGVTSQWADVEQAYDYWAKRLKERLDELSGRVEK